MVVHCFTAKLVNYIDEQDVILGDVQCDSLKNSAIFHVLYSLQKISAL